MTDFLLALCALSLLLALLIGLRQRHAVQLASYLVSLVIVLGFFIVMAGLYLGDGLKRPRP